MKTIRVGNRTYTLALYEFLRDNHSTGINTKEALRSPDYVHRNVRYLFRWSGTEEGWNYWRDVQQEFSRLQRDKPSKDLVKHKHRRLI